MKDTTDIIIPLYNGYSFFKECIDSILKNTAEETYQLIVVDDCSTEKQLLEYLQKIDKKGIIVLRNKVNIGFVGSCNRGMRYEDKNDVLLLNSDTVVTKNWLEKIRKCAYSRKNIGTVTPISNNATLVSFPKQWEDNEIPKGYTLDLLADLIEKISLEIYPEIPSPVGFCMFIKREVIKKIGFFDEVYGRGYGEENDFGMRAYQDGYRHTLDDATFIQHKGSMTFRNISKEKDALIKKNSKILHSRFPELDKLLKEFDKEKPLESIFNNIIINIETDKLQKRGILFVSVDEPDRFASGALLHTQNLIDNVDDSFNKYLVYRDRNKIVLVFYENSGKKIRYVFDFFESFNISKHSHAEIEFIWELILKNFNIDTIHFQTPQELPLSLFKLSKELGKNVFFTAHDFFLYCPSFILMRRNPKKKYLEFCNYEKDEEICKKCLGEKMGINISTENFQSERRTYITNNVLPFIDKFIFPSNFLKNAILNLFAGQISIDKTLVIPHGIKNSKNDYTPIQEEIVNIAYIGSFMKEKGSQIFADIVRRTKENSRLKFFIIGAIGDEDSLSMIKKMKNLEIIGRYKNEELPKIIRENKINLACVLSLCPETFSLTISEAWANNLPIITLAIGAQGARIIDSNAGWAVKLENAEEKILKIIDQIINNKEILLDKIKNIPPIKNEKENAKEFELLYEASCISKKEESVLDTKRMFQYIERKETEKYIQEESETSKKLEKKRYSLDRSYIKHLAFVLFNKIGMINRMRPFYYKHKDKIDNFINCFTCSSS